MTTDHEQKLQSILSHLDTIAADDANARERNRYQQESLNADREGLEHRWDNALIPMFLNAYHDLNSKIPSGRIKITADKDVFSTNTFTLNAEDPENQLCRAFGEFELGERGSISLKLHGSGPSFNEKPISKEKKIFTVFDADDGKIKSAFNDILALYLELKQRGPAVSI